MNTSSSIGGGMVGAAALTLVNETTRRFYDKAPKLNQLGIEAIRKIADAVGQSRPKDSTAFAWSLSSDLLVNALFYSLAGVSDDPKKVLSRSAMYGVGAGLAAVYLPKPLGISHEYTNGSAKTRMMTILWYTIGSIVAGATINFLDDQIKNLSKQKEPVKQFQPS